MINNSIINNIYGFYVNQGSNNNYIRGNDLISNLPAETQCISIIITIRTYPIIPIVKESTGRYTVYDLNENISINNEADVLKIEKNIRLRGFYPYRTTPSDYEKLKQDPKNLKTFL